MPLPPASTLSTTLNLAMLAEPEIMAVDGPALDKFCDVLAQVMISLIQSGTVTVAAGIPVTTAGGPSSQTGATTATGTGSIA